MSLIITNRYSNANMAENGENMLKVYKHVRDVCIYKTHQLSQPGEDPASIQI